MQLAWLILVVAAIGLTVADEPVFGLKLVDSDIVTSNNALCLSGTPAGYYFRPGSAINATKFKIHFEGGGCE